MKVLKVLVVVCVGFAVGYSVKWLSCEINNAKEVPVRPKDDRMGAIYLHHSQFKGVSQRGNRVNVRYQAGLGPLADLIAEIVDNAWAHIYNSTGVNPIISECTFYLIQIPTDRPIFLPTAYVFTEERHLRQILFVDRNNISCESVVAQNKIFPSILFHEMVEVTVRHQDSLFIRDKSLALTDNSHLKMGTARWFCDGFSDYCGLLAYESMISNENFDQEKVLHIRLLNNSFSKPFSSIMKIRTALFDWHRDSNFPDPPLDNMPCDYHTWQDYYDAAFGLFWLIRDKFGEEAIKDIISEIKLLEIADGHGLIKATNSALQIDIKQFVENFDFPQTGLYIKQVWPTNSDYLPGVEVLVVEQNSLAQKAGIKKGDIIYKLNDIEVGTNIDFEIALYRLMSNNSVTIYLRREEVGEVAIDLKLSEQSTKNN